MRRLLPRPWLSLLMWLTWLALNNTVDPAHILLGAGIGVGIPLLAGRFLPDVSRVQAPWLAVRLALIVLVDIVIANLEVARRILGPESALQPGFVRVPLDLKDQIGVAALAGIVTLTPGTLSADLVAGPAGTGNCLLVHALHVEDEAALIASIKQRYEAPLRAMFP